MASLGDGSGPTDRTVRVSIHDSTSMHRDVTTCRRHLRSARLSPPGMAGTGGRRQQVLLPRFTVS